MTNDHIATMPRAPKPEDSDEQFGLLLARDAIAGLEDALAGKLVPEAELDAALLPSAPELPWLGSREE